jgi:hypothetical protein
VGDATFAGVIAESLTPGGTPETENGLPSHTEEQTVILPPDEAGELDL